MTDDLPPDIDPEDFVEAYRIVRNFQDEGRERIRKRLNIAFADKQSGYVVKLLAAIYSEVNK